MKPNNSQVITIVSGLPRSGTSMMMQFLQAGGMDVLSDESRLADANNPRGYLEYAPVKGLAKNTDWLNLAQGKAVKIIVQLLPFLPDYFHYRVLFMQRDIAEILDSQQRMLESLGKPSGPSATLKKIYSQQLQRVQNQMLNSPHIELLNIPHQDMYQKNTALFTQINHFCADRLDLENAATAIDVTLYRSQYLDTPT